MVFARDILDLYECFHPFRREWDDQLHRQTVSREEMREMRRAGRAW